MVKLIRSAKSTIENDDISSVVKVLKREFLGMGPKVAEFEKFLSDRKIGEIIVKDRPILIKTDIMHRVVITEAPRCAWVTRWNNVPKVLDYYDFKTMAENIL